MKTRNTLVILLAAGVGVALAGTALAQQRSEPISYWPFDSDLTDQAGTGTANDGTAVDDAQVDASEKKYGAGSLLLDGTDDYVQVVDDDLDIPGSNITVVAWVRPDAIGSVMGVMGKGNARYYLRIETDGITRAAINTTTGWQSGCFGAPALVASEWTHVAFTYDGTTVLRYINGIQAPGTRAHTGTLEDSAGLNWEGCIGRQLMGLQDTWFDGHIDEVAVWDETLDVGEINDVMDNGVMVPKPGTLIYGM